MNNLDFHKIADSRKIVTMIENDITKNLPQVKLDVKHYFIPGVYIRELHIPKGVVLTGEIHKYNQYHFLLSGKLSVLINDKMDIIEAPKSMFTLAGAKRIAKALEDTIWIMFHGTNETDLNKIRNEFVVSTEEEYQKFLSQEPPLPFLESDLKCLT